MLLIKNSYNQICSFGSLESIAREHARELNTCTREYTACERKVTSELYRSVVGNALHNNINTFQVMKYCNALHMY